MKKLLLILLCLPIIGFGQKRDSRRTLESSRSTHVTQGEKNNSKIRRKFRKEYKINNEDFNISNLRLLVDDISSLSNRIFTKKGGFLYYKGMLFSGVLYEVYDDQSISLENLELPVYKEVNYKNGLKHAFSTSWYSNKQMKRRSYLVNNQIVSMKEWYENGQIKYDIAPLKDSLNRILTYEFIDDSITYVTVDNYKEKLSADIYFDSLQIDKYANEKKEKIIQINNSKLDVNNLIGNTKHQVEKHNILIDSLRIYNRSLNIYMSQNVKEKVQNIIVQYNKKGKLPKKKMVIYSGYLERKIRVDKTENNIKHAVESISSNDLEINSHLSKIVQYENELVEISELCAIAKNKPLLPFVKLCNAWHENGQIARKWKKIKDDKLEGIHQIWYDNGQIYFMRNYKNGNLHGVWQEWYQNGQLKSKINYKKGKLHGLLEKWHENGQKKTEEYLKEGYTVGPYFKMWYDDGQLSTLKSYTKDGIKHGAFEEWDDKFGKIKEYYYVNGKLHGFKKEWNLDGELIYKAEWSNGENINEENNINLELDKANLRASKLPCRNSYGGRKLMDEYLKDLDGTQIVYKGRRHIFNSMPNEMQIYIDSPPKYFSWQGFCYIGNDAPSVYVTTKNGCKSFGIEIIE